MSGPETITFQKGEVILKQGDPGDSAFLIQMGKVEVFRSEGEQHKPLGVLQAGGIFGEMALIDPAPRSATARALERTICTRITRETLDRALKQAPPMVRYLLRSFIRNIRAANGQAQDETQDRADAVYMSESDSKQRILERRAYADGDLIFRQGSDGSTAYLLQSGRVDLIRDTEDGQHLMLRQLRPGDVFGEMALLRAAPRFATALVVGSANVEVLRADKFNDMLVKGPPFLRALVRIYVEMVGSAKKA
ncbi:cyclic nucleotide-binding domain-containing protein [Ferrovibrio sp.]|uniref:cyclic nucleotide-binding domain-containing protein n=1 Tax=Ferrovibrio sp. TaxID=1917215 RepID=UPI0035B217D4